MHGERHDGGTSALRVVPGREVGDRLHRPSKPVEVAFFDHGPVAGTGGHWTSYWYNGRIYGSEIARGFDVLSLAGGFGQGAVKQPYLNAQTQQPLKR